VYQAELELSRRFPRAVERSRQAIALAEQHGWSDETTTGLACNTLGSALGWQGHLAEAAGWLQRAERTIRPEAAPVSAMGVQFARGQVELARGRSGEALAAFRSAERLARRLPEPHPLARPIRVWTLHALIRSGDIGAVKRLLSGTDRHVRERGELRIATAALRLAVGDPGTAVAELGPVLDGSARVGWRSWLAQAFLLDAIASDALGNPAAAGRAIERALEEAEPDGALLWFLLHPAPVLLERHARQGTAHEALIAQILNALAENRLDVQPKESQLSFVPLSDSELRVLRYLPTHLSAPEIAAELSVSVHTVKTHLRNLYIKLGVHRRADAVESARVLHLIAPSAPGPGHPAPPEAD
jgi:LuxR family maltose regulon positive regulatory protein